MWNNYELIILYIYINIDISLINKLDFQKCVSFSAVLNFVWNIIGKPIILKCYLISLKCLAYLSLHKRYAVNIPQLQLTLTIATFSTITPCICIICRLYFRVFNTRTRIWWVKKTVKSYYLTENMLVFALFRSSLPQTAINKTLENNLTPQELSNFRKEMYHLSSKVNNSIVKSTF